VESFLFAFSYFMVEVCGCFGWREVWKMKEVIKSLEVLECTVGHGNRRGVCEGQV
jgi:hypothetical protein